MKTEYDVKRGGVQRVHHDTRRAGWLLFAVQIARRPFAIPPGGFDV